MTPITKQEAGQIVAAMAEDYKLATAQLEAARSGLVSAISDAKVHELSTAELMQLSGWSRSTIKSIAAYSVTTPTESAGQPLTPHGVTQCPSEDIGQPAETSDDHADATA